MENRWTLTDKVKEKYKPIIQEFLTKMENLTLEEIEDMENEEFQIELSDTELNPFTLLELLKEFGYENEEFDSNGWQFDYNIDIYRKDNSFPSTCENLRIWGTGITFELILTVKEFI